MADNRMWSPESVLGFLQVVYKLKSIKRTGWVYRGISEPETIASHMYGVALLAFLIQDTRVDRDRCIKMALMHDLAEAIVGDITPHDNVSNEDKAKMEQEAFAKLRDMIGTKEADEMYALFMEYEQGTTPEAQLVKQLDKFDMLLQANEYEIVQKKNLDEFFESTKGNIVHNELKKLNHVLDSEREMRKSPVPPQAAYVSTSKSSE